jgi:hypothetical protein
MSFEALDTFLYTFHYFGHAPLPVVCSPKNWRMCFLMVCSALHGIGVFHRFRRFDMEADIDSKQAGLVPFHTVHY